MNFFKIKYSAFTLTLVATLCGSLLQSCQDEVIDHRDYTVTGKPVMVTVNVKIPQMDAKSRATLVDADLNRVTSLWIRTYSATTGKATSDWITLTPNTIDKEVSHSTDVSFETQSGSSYIVGVANVSNMGVTKDNPSTQLPLSELLEAADTWADFLNIAAVAPSTYATVNGPDTPLPMAGCYTDITPGGTHPGQLSDWQSLNFTPYFIPASTEGVTLSDGAIHLRRLISNMTFNIIPGENIDVTVNSYQVMNAPKYSWLYERPEEDGMTTNFGDASTAKTQGDYFAQVPQYASQYAQKKQDGSSSFSFWLSESKHEGTSTTYRQRDMRDATDRALFTSLTGEAWTPNNMAAYVRVSCSIEYLNDITVGSQGQLQTDGDEVHRTGNVEYYIHLGYVEGSTVAEKSKDFNCYRNVNYTYNVTVNGVDDIRVDAWADTESFPGEEGLVSDLQYSTIELDAHYHAFNIELTEAELADPNFGYIITTYMSGNQYNITEKTDLAQLDENLYNWIELRATTAQMTLAEYKPRSGYTYGSDEKHTFLLTDLKGGGSSLADNQKSTSGYYTVFVNEYAYETIYTGASGSNYGNETSSGSGNPNWMSYVNQNPRRFYIRVTRNASADGLSVYTRSKYGISQSSMQTFYSDQVYTPASGNIARGTAIASERYNETEGLNMCRPGDYGYSSTNGRYNAANWVCRNNSGSYNTLSINGAENGRPLWSTVVDMTAPMQIPAVASGRAQGGPELPDRTGANAVKLPKLANSLNSRNYTYSDPQASDNRDYYIDTYNACMSRNRDNNGNGRIDPEELRWFIPTMTEYLRLLIGSPSLSQPIMDFASVSTLPKGTSTGWNGTGEVGNDYLSRYMFTTSDNARVLWAMEGMSTSTWSQVSSDWSGGTAYPWQIRCVRNLGTDMTSVTDGNKVVDAYTHDSSAHTIAFTYYDEAGIRQSSLSGNGASGVAGVMPPNDITSDYNKPFRKFEYSTVDITVSGSYTENRQTIYYKSLEGLQRYIENNPCGSNSQLSGTGWRVPNQSELAILTNIRQLTVNGTYLSCTYNYFNSNTGAGGGYTNGQNQFLGFIGSGTGDSRGTRFSSGNISSWNMYVRCVRDRDD